MLKPNQFFDKKQDNKKKKELYFFSILSIISISSIAFYSYILNNPIIVSDIPTIKIVAEGEITKNDEMNCTIELSSKNSEENVELIQGTIRLRGRYNVELPKKDYRLELSDPLPLLGMRDDDDWILFAMYNDLPKMQIKLAMELYRKLYATNPTAILPSSRYVILYLNGKFQGLFLLAEKNDRKLFGLDKVNAAEPLNSSFIIQSSYDHENFKYYLNEEWEQDYPNQEEGEGFYIMDTIMTDLVLFVSNTSDELFFDEKNGVYSKFNRQNLIDFYVYNFFILHDDFWTHNYFIIRNTNTNSNPSKLILIPWDFDRCFGQWMKRKSSFERNDQEFIRSNNELFNRLLNDNSFRVDCKNRWFELRETIWSEEVILDMLTEYYNEIKDIMDNEADLWYPWLFSEGWREEVDVATERLFDWIPERLIFCDSYFEAF